MDVAHPDGGPCRHHCSALSMSVAGVLTSSWSPLRASPEEGGASRRTGHAGGSQCPPWRSRRRGRRVVRGAGGARAGRAVARRVSRAHVHGRAHESTTRRPPGGTGRKSSGRKADGSEQQSGGGPGTFPWPTAPWRCPVPSRAQRPGIEAGRCSSAGLGAPRRSRSPSPKGMAVGPTWRVAPTTLNSLVLRRLEPVAIRAAKVRLGRSRLVMMSLAARP